MKAMFLRFLCMIGIHDLEVFHPIWMNDLPPEIQQMHYNHFCVRCG